MDVITRPAFWNIDGREFLYLVLAIEIAVFAYGLYRLYRRWRMAARIARFDEVRRRLRQVAAQAIAQRRLLRDRSAGLAHLALSWGFALLFVGTLVAMLDYDFGLPVMRGTFYLWFQSLTLDIAGLAAIVGLTVLMWRRYVVKVARLRQPADRARPLPDALLPSTLLVILLTGFVLEGIRIAVTKDPWGLWSPVGFAVASLLQGAGGGDVMLKQIHAGVWWFHLTLASGFVAAIPYTKLMHVIAAPFNLFFAPVSGRPADLALRRIDFDAEGPIGVSTRDMLNWKQALDLETCTECGRCQDMCPAFAVGQPLSPKALILDLRDHARGLAPRMPVNTLAGAPRPLASGELAPIIAAASPEALWSCVTCGACVEACPVGIEHVRALVDMRRHLVMEAASYPERLQKAVANIEARGTPFLGVGVSRTAWTRGLDVPRMADRRRAEYLFWVGCAAAFDERGQKVARAIATVLGRARVDFAILGDEEWCTGDAARRIGDEVLFMACAERNIETLSRYEFGTIVTGCAHCFNSLKNEYPQMGGNYCVVHHSELLHDLICAGRLQANVAVDALATFHDPCYLGRYNGKYEIPRAVLSAVPGLRVVEMPHSRERSFCCGAGGGQNWTTEVAGGRISHARADQAIATGASIVATACSFCAPMLKDGLAVRGPQSGAQVLDIAEIVQAATSSTPTPSPGSNCSLQGLPRHGDPSAL